jgi:aromatic-L-amino-acid/L-tryptophan decarboxylase
VTKPEFLEASARTAEWVADYAENIRQHPVLGATRPGDIARQLPARAPNAGEPMAAILDDFEHIIVPGLTHWNHPGFFAYYANSGTPPGVIADTLAAAVNVNAMQWRASPAATELEQVTLAWLREWLALPPEFFGLIYDTASMSTVHALIAARHRVAPNAREQGNPPGLTMYTSEQANSSVEKAAIGVGIGQANVRKIAMDTQFRMRPEALAQAIAADRTAGKRPFCIVAAIGTTATASIDPIPEIADIAAREGLWLHVDAAYGGSFAVLNEMKPLCAGWERADSIVVNPHKSLLVPVDLSAFYTRHPEVLRQALSLIPDYLATPTGEENLTDYSVQLGRRFRALKLWFVMRNYGRQGVETILRTHADCARQFASWVEADGRFELAAPVTFSLVCFRLKAGDAQTRAMLDQINASGKAFLSSTTLNGKLALRLAIGNYHTGLDDVRAVWEALQKQREQAQPNNTLLS